MGVQTAESQNSAWPGYCEHLLSQLPEALLILDREGKITRANRAAEMLLGLGSRGLLGQRYDSPALFADRGWSMVRVDFGGEPLTPPPPHPAEEALTSRDCYENALFLLERRPQSRAYLAADAIPLRSDLGSEVGVALLYRDVTEQQSHRSESEWLRRDLMRTRDQVEELLRLSQSLNAVNDSLHTALDTNETPRMVLRLASEALGVPSASIDMREPEGWTTNVAWGLRRDVVGRVLPDAAAALDTLVAASGDALAIADVRDDERVEPEMFEHLGARSILAVPLLARDRVIGVLSFHRPSPAPWSPEQTGYAQKVAWSTALAIENARVYAEERHIADTLQRALLVIPASVKGLEHDYLYQSATEAAWVGGDFFDLFELSDDRVGIVIGDVAGKGVEASALASFTRQLIRAHAQGETSPARSIARTSDLVFLTSRPDDFVTLFFGIIDRREGTLTYCSAGHPPPVLCRGGVASPLLDHGPIAGAWGELEWQDHSTLFARGDLLLLYTDGVTEARRHGELYGEERLVDLVGRLASEPIQAVARAVLREVTDYAQGRLRDDVAILAVSPT